MKQALLAALMAASLTATALARDGETTLSAAAQADLGDARRATAPFVDINAATNGVFASAWTAKEPPRLFGTDFHLTSEGNRYGIPAFYALHVWMWQPNPKGLFADYNPAVRCP